LLRIPLSHLLSIHSQRATTINILLQGLVIAFFRQQLQEDG